MRVSDSEQRKSMVLVTRSLLFLIANIVTSKAPVTTSEALVTTRINGSSMLQKDEQQSIESRVQVQVGFRVV